MSDDVTRSQAGSRAATPREVIAQAVYKPFAGTEPLTDAVRSIVAEESAFHMERALVDADRILAALSRNGYSVCLVGRPGAPKVRDVL